MINHSQAEGERLPRLIQEVQRLKDQAKTLEKGLRYYKFDETLGRYQDEVHVQVKLAERELLKLDESRASEEETAVGAHGDNATPPSTGESRPR